MIKPKKDNKGEKKDIKSRELQEALEEINQRFGEGAIMKLDAITHVDVDAVPTGALSLDLALGIGGLPRGRVIEIFGGESSGKTTLALHVVAEAQKKGGTAAFIDAEHAMDPEYAGKIGVNMKDLLISQPDSGEQALQIVETLVNSKAVDIIVVDSVAALTPKTEIEGEIGDTHVALQARLMSQALRKLTSILAKTNTVMIFLNQTRMKIGIMFGNPETTPGGMALKFYASVRINLKRIAQIKKGEQVTGSRVKAQIVKNKVAAPFKTAEFDIYYSEGISKAADLFNLALKYGVVKKTGLTYYFGQQKMGQSLDHIKEFFKASPKAEAEIRQLVLEKNKAIG